MCKEEETNGESALGVQSLSVDIKQEPLEMPCAARLMKALSSGRLEQVQALLPASLHQLQNPNTREVLGSSLLIAALREEHLDDRPEETEAICKYLVADLEIPVDSKVEES